MRVEPNQNTNPLKKAAPAKEPAAHEHATPHARVQTAAKTGKVSSDSAQLSHHAQGALDEAHGEHDMMSTIAHSAHNPHGALHAIEAGEQGLAAAARLARAGRGVAAVAEASEVADHAAHHAGLVHKLEHSAGHLATKAGGWLAETLGKLPGGTKLVNGVKSVFGAPGRAIGAAARAGDAALEGSRVGNAVRLTGAGGRFVAQAGGRIPIVGAVLGGVIAAVDVKDAIKTIKDPKATTGQKFIAGSQGLLSGASGVLGVGALGVAAAAAIGLTAPVSVPVLLAGAAITGVGAFALSFFKH